MGCFWRPDILFAKMPGVVKTEVGYQGGDFEDPTYEDVCSGNTGHAETVRIEYDPKKVSYETLLKIFWENHNPTTINRQGPDIGSQYRSVIFFYTPEQEKLAKASKTALEKAKKYDKMIVTEIRKATPFYKAEDYHQKYLEKNQGAFCP